MINMEEIKFGRWLSRILDAISKRENKHFYINGTKDWMHLQWLERRMHYDITMSREFK